MLYLLFSHRFPSHASLQTHEKLSPSPAFKQVAPFWQGSDEQGLGARQKGKQYNKLSRTCAATFKKYSI